MRAVSGNQHCNVVNWTTTNELKLTIKLYKAERSFRIRRGVSVVITTSHPFPTVTLSLLYIDGSSFKYMKCLDMQMCTCLCPVCTCNHVLVFICILYFFESHVCFPPLYIALLQYIRWYALIEQLSDVDYTKATYGEELSHENFLPNHINQRNFRTGKEITSINNIL